jgi:hypothetical protein
MKAILSIIGVLLFLNSNAQKFDCSSKMKEYQEIFQAKKIAESYAIWTDVSKNCPKQSEVLYTDGIDILQYKIDNAPTPEEKEKLVRSLLKVYDQYNKNFPLTTTDFEVKKGMVLFTNKVGTNDEIFSLLNSGFDKASKNVTDANTIYTYFSLYFEKYTADKTKITTDMVLDKYMQVNTMLSNLLIVNAEKKVEYVTAIKGIRSMIKELNTCDNLATYYQKNFEANKDNADWLNVALGNLTTKCAGEPIYNAIAEANYKLEPTAKSAHYMAMTCIKQRRFPEAIQFFTESEALETNPLEKAKLNYSLATGLLSKDLGKSKALLLKATTQDPQMGRAYIYLAEQYGNSAEECGKTDFEKKAIYFLALETAKKASAVEPRLKPTVEKMSERFIAKAPTSKEISDQKMNGKSIKIDCWINETITFPSK